MMIASLGAIVSLIVVPIISVALGRIQARKAEREACDVQAIVESARHHAMFEALNNPYLKFGRPSLDEAIVYGPATAKSRQLERDAEDRRARVMSRVAHR